MGIRVGGINQRRVRRSGDADAEDYGDHRADKSSGCLIAFERGSIARYGYLMRGASAIGDGFTRRLAV